MVKKFEFDNNLLEVDINGAKFQIDPNNPKLLERMEKHGINMQKVAGEMEEVAEKESNAKAMEQMIQVCLDTIDAVLGEGASKDIFKGRKVSFFDTIDVINFMTSEIEKARDNLYQKYTPNRAQRRAKK